jgi:hypothetical protein
LGFLPRFAAFSAAWQRGFCLARLLLVLPCSGIGIQIVNIVPLYVLKLL